MNELLPGAKVPSILLEGEAESNYVDRLKTIFRRSRLNAHYPDARHLTSHVATLSPDFHRGMYDGVQVDTRTGLPTYREWTRAQTDVRLAPNQLRNLGPRSELERKARRDDDSIHERLLHKYDYYADIQAHDLVPLGDMTVRLRRIDEKRSMAYFNVILDKLDVSGVFVRYTIDVGQRRDSVSRIANVDAREVANQTEDFQSLIYRFTSLDAEFTFVKLATMGGLAVERVIKGIVGPFYFDFVDTPDFVRSFVEEHGFLATFGLDMAATDIADDKDNDPFSEFFDNRLTEEGRAGYEAARGKLSYKVFKDRKFVSERRAVGAVRALCAEFDTRNIVYGV